MHTDPTREPGWVPPHCPRASCRYHNQLAQPWPFIRKGYYTRSSDRIHVQRFRCRTCGVNFSTQTFSTQKRRRQELEQRLGRPDPQSVRQDVTELLQVVLAHVELPPRWRQYYERTVQTREYVNNRIHELKYAF